MKVEIQLSRDPRGMPINFRNVTVQLREGVLFLHGTKPYVRAFPLSAITYWTEDSE